MSGLTKTPCYDERILFPECTFLEFFFTLLMTDIALYYSPGFC